MGDIERGPRLTEPTLRILRALLEHPENRMYGYELLRSTGLQSGTLYPALARLRNAGWLAGEKEIIDAATEGRPARTYYQLTATGATSAQRALSRLTLTRLVAQPVWAPS